MANPDSTDVQGLSLRFAPDSLTSRPRASAAACLITMAALAAIGAVGFASTPLLAVVTFAAAITVVMVFVIQHAESTAPRPPDQVGRTGACAPGRG